jgi:hypothetical protein
LDIDPSDEGRLAGDSTRSIQKSLDRFFSTEIREINCEKCEDGQLAEQTMRILTAPKALILHLKRFSVESTGGTTATTNQVDENKPNDNKHGDVDFYVLKKKVCASTHSLFPALFVPFFPSFKLKLFRTHRSTNSYLACNSPYILLMVFDRIKFSSTKKSLWPNTLRKHRLKGKAVTI